MRIKKNQFNILITLLFFCLITFSCQLRSPKENAKTEEPEEQIKTTSFFTIPFADIIKTKREVKLSEIAESVEFIQFENSEKSLLGNVLDVKLTNNYIFVKHSGDKRLTQFNRQGKFIQHFGTIGRGPKEYALMRMFSLDRKNELVYIQTNWTKKMLVYNFDGEYIKTLKYPTVERMHNVWARDSFIVSFGEPYKGFEPNVFIETSFSGDTIQTIKNQIFWEKKGKNGFITSYWGRNAFYWTNNKLHMKGWYNDTVYTYNSKCEIVPKYFIDLKEHKIPEELIPEKRPQKPLPKKCYWLGANESNHFVFVRYGLHGLRKSGEGDSGCVLFNKKSNRGTALKNQGEKYGFINDLTAGPDFIPRFSNDTIAFGTVSALDMKQYLDSDQFKNHEVKFPDEKENLNQLNKTLKEDDNHFLVVVKLKDSMK